MCSTVLPPDSGGCVDVFAPLSATGKLFIDWKKILDHFKSDIFWDIMHYIILFYSTSFFLSQVKYWK